MIITECKRRLTKSGDIAEVKSLSFCDRLQATIKKSNNFTGTMLILDCSGSMGEKYDGKSKYEYLLDAIRELKCDKLYFNSVVRTTQMYPSGSTNLTAALEAIPPTTKKIILVSDGLPDNQDSALNVAESRRIPIETILIGDDPKGIAFMKTLSAVSGGRVATNVKIEDLPTLKGQLLALSGSGR